ncbi:hypothetical protein P8605_47690 [Streptomyces sp. T-3]|nr:hypothetical protein [Streptomyces sp. T-3]
MTDLPSAPHAERVVDTSPTGAEITSTECPQCGAQVAGLNGRYACGICGWVNHWSQGHGDLPTAEQDPDYPGPDAPRPTAQRRRRN